MTCIETFEHHLIQERLTLEDLLNPADKVVNDSEVAEIPSDEVIIHEINRELAIESGRIIKVDSDSDSESGDGEIKTIGRAAVIELCCQLESACLSNLMALLYCWSIYRNTGQS